MLSKKPSILDRVRAEVVRETIGARPYLCRCRLRSDRCSIVSAPMLSEKRTVLDRVRADVVREVVGTRPCPRRCLFAKRSVDRVRADAVREVIGTQPYPCGARSRSRCSSNLKLVLIFAGPKWSVHLQNNAISTVMGATFGNHFRTRFLRTAVRYPLSAAGLVLGPLFRTRRAGRMHAG